MFGTRVRLLPAGSQFRPGVQIGKTVPKFCVSAFDVECSSICAAGVSFVASRDSSIAVDLCSSNFFLR